MKRTMIRFNIKVLRITPMFLLATSATAGGSKAEAIGSVIELVGSIVQITMSVQDAKNVEAVVIEELGKLRPNEKVIGRYYVDSISGEPTYWNYQTTSVEGWFYITSERIAYHPVGRGRYWSLQSKIEVPIRRLHSVKVERSFSSLGEPVLTFSIAGMEGDHSTQSLYALRPSRMEILNTMSMSEVVKLSKALSALAAGSRLKSRDTK